MSRLEGCILILILARRLPLPDAVFIAVGTPTRRGDGHADLSFVYAAAEDIAMHLSGYTVVVTEIDRTGWHRAAMLLASLPKQTLMQNLILLQILNFCVKARRFLTFMRPDRVVVGAETDAARDVMRALYRPLFLIETPILFTNLETSELIKYASNAFLAVKISYINQMADLV
jgi:UDPglucose 6-dehydrogenase